MNNTTNGQKTLEMFYDFSSPYAYLGHQQAQQVAAAANAPFQPRPFLLGGLFKALGSAMVPILEAVPQKRRMLDLDLHRLAELHGLPMRWPSRFPMNTVLPLRVVTQLEGEAHLRAMSAIFRAYWGDDRDISDAKVLTDVLASAGFTSDEVAAWLAAAEQADVKAALRGATEEAFARGAIGAPTFFVGDLCVWGQDRFALVDRMLRGWRPKVG